MTRTPIASTEVRDLRTLLEAVAEALTLPYDADNYDRRLLERVSWARTVVTAVVEDDTEDVGWNADYLRRKMTAEQADADERAERGDRR